MSSLRAFARRSALWAIALVMVAIAGSASAKADSITYDVTATFSNGLTFSGDYVWDNGLGAATGYLFNLTNTAAPASCSDATGTLCTFSYALFDGTGSFAGTIEAVLSLLDPHTPQFSLAILDAQGNQIGELETVNPTPTVHVPEPAETGLLVLGMVLLAGAFRRARTLGLMQT
ncbi:MAG TPA: hypothetical protein VGF06_13095 [Terriglobales bacterium]|jgi:hypothetical protein